MNISEATNHYEVIMLEELVQNLVGTTVIAKAPNVPAGTQTVSKDKLMQKESKAKIGKKGQPIPRETSEIVELKRLIKQR